MACNSLEEGDVIWGEWLSIRAGYDQSMHVVGLHKRVTHRLLVARVQWNRVQQYATVEQKTHLQTVKLSEIDSNKDIRFVEKCKNKRAVNW